MKGLLHEFLTLDYLFSFVCHAIFVCVSKHSGFVAMSESK